MGNFMGKLAKPVGTGLAGGFLIYNLANADIIGFVQDSPDGVSGKDIPVKIYREEVTGGTDTLFTFTDGNGLYAESEFSFDPIPSSGDTFFIYAYNGNYDARLMFEVPAPNNLEISLDNPGNPIEAFTLNLGSPTFPGITDTLQRDDRNYELTFWLDKNPADKYTKHIDAWYQGSEFFRWHTDLENLTSNANNGDGIHLTVHQTFNDTTYLTTIAGIINKEWLGAQLVTDSVLYPDGFYVTDWTPPTISNVTALDNTSYAGPFDVEATITDASGIDSGKTRIRYEFDSSPPESSNADSVIGDRYWFTIPPVPNPTDTTLVGYNISATDSSENANVTNWPGPSPSDYWYFTVTPPTGVVEELRSSGNLELKLMISPNPGRGGFNFLASRDGLLKVYDVAGRVVRNERIIRGENELNLEGLASGNYIARVEDGESKSNAKMFTILR